MDGGGEKESCGGCETGKGVRNEDRGGRDIAMDYFNNTTILKQRSIKLQTCLFTGPGRNGHKLVSRNQNVRAGKQRFGRLDKSTELRVITKRPGQFSGNHAVQSFSRKSECELQQYRRQSCAYKHVQRVNNCV